MKYGTWTIGFSGNSYALIDYPTTNVSIHVALQHIGMNEVSDLCMALHDVKCMVEKEHGVCNSFIISVLYTKARKKANLSLVCISADTKEQTDLFNVLNKHHILKVDTK